MLTVYNPDTLDENQLIYTTVAYVAANLDKPLPREGEAPTPGPTPDPPRAAILMSLLPLLSLF